MSYRDGEENQVVHVLRDGAALCNGAFLVELPNDKGVTLESAVDPNILKVTCPVCAAKVNMELKQG